jgi:glycosyltransferase involved in cell wall biosynthesis
MKIGFDVSQTGKLKAGCGYFADTLIRSLAEIDRENEYILYPTFGDLYWDPDWPSGVCQILRPRFQFWPGHKSLEEAKYFWNHPPADFETRMGAPDLIHSNNFFCPTGLKNARLVYTLYDLSFLAQPEWTTEENRIGCFKGVFNASLYADLIVSISHYSRDHFLKVFPHYPPNRIAVVHPASRFSGIRDIPQPQKVARLAPNRFWLNVGVLEPRKNQQRMLKAYAELKREMGETFPLVLAGGRGWLMEDFEERIDTLDLKRDVILLGKVEDDSLQWLYQNCFAFLYPSLFEGFGLPVLEAMSLGAPVIVSKISSIPEVVEDAGILIDPLDEKSICEAMWKMATDESLRPHLKKAALSQSSHFSWKSAASAVLDCYRKTLSLRPLFQK